MDTIDLRNGIWEASVAPLLGANVINLTCGGCQVLRRPEESADSYQFGMPILIPANRTYHGRFVFEGKTYRLPINEPRTPAQLHGQIHNRFFQVLHQETTAAELCYDAVPDSYPFPFRLTVAYNLQPDGLHVTHTIINTGDTNLPFTFGLHTTFCATEYFRVPLGEKQEYDETGLLTGRYIPLTPDETEFIRGMNPSEKNVCGFFRSGGHQAMIGAYRYTVSENFDHWVLYNAGGGAGILCVEPQCGAVDGLNIPDGHRVLKPGERMSFRTAITK